MRIISHLLAATVALVFVFGLLGSLLSASRASSRAFGRRSFGLAGAQAWVTGFGGSMGGDGSPPEGSPTATTGIQSS